MSHTVFSVESSALSPLLALRQPPYVSLDKNEYVRLIGEELVITCTSHNPNYKYMVSWISSNKVRLAGGCSFIQHWTGNILKVAMCN